MAFKPWKDVDETAYGSFHDKLPTRAPRKIKQEMREYMAPLSQRDTRQRELEHTPMPQSPIHRSLSQANPKPRKKSGFNYKSPLSQRDTRQRELEHTPMPQSPIHLGSALSVGKDIGRAVLGGGYMEDVARHSGDMASYLGNSPSVGEGIGRTANVVATGYRELARTGSEAAKGWLRDVQSSGEDIHRGVSTQFEQPREIGLPERAKQSSGTSGISAYKAQQQRAGTAGPGVAMTDMQSVPSPKYAKGGAPTYSLSQRKDARWAKRGDGYGLGKVNTDAGMFQRLPGGGYSGRGGEMLYEGPSSAASGAGMGGRINANAMQEANANMRRGGGGGSFSVVSPTGEPSTGSLQGDIDRNVAFYDQQTAGIRDLRNAQREAQGMPPVGTRRASGPIQSSSQTWDDETKAHNARVTRNNALDDIKRIRNPKNQREAMQQFGATERAAMQQAGATEREAMQQGGLARGAAMDYAANDRQMALGDKASRAQQEAEHQAKLANSEQTIRLKKLDAMLKSRADLSKEQRTQYAEGVKAGYQSNKDFFQTDPMNSNEGNESIQGQQLLVDRLYGGLLNKAMSGGRMLDPQMLSTAVLEGVFGMAARNLSIEQLIEQLERQFLGADPEKTTQP